MKQQPWLIFLKYPYSTAVLACFWIGSAVMLFIDRNLPILPIIITDIIFSWVITWLSYRPSGIK